MTDKTLNCRDCGMDFTFTTSEQEFFQSKGFTNEPSRCPSCRASRKSARNDGGYSGGYSSGGYDRGERQFFNVTCSECGGNARVPFQPREDRPVYCSDCFEKQGRGSGGGYAGSRGGRDRW